MAPLKTEPREPLLGLGVRVLSIDGVYKGTCRYLGPLKHGDKTVSGQWIGVEWDDPMRGNHDGSVDTVRYFHCLRGGSGSLVRAQKIIPGVEFAVEFVSCYDCNEDDYKHIRVVHPRTIETMTQAIMTGRNISTAGHMSSVAPFLTNLTSLDLSNNLFLGPSQVAKILTATPALRFLSLSSNALSPDPVPSQSTRTDGRAARNEDGLKAPVQDLNLNEGEVGEKWWCEELPMMAHLLHLRLSNTGLAAAEAAEWVRRAPQLSELHFCSNHVATRGEVAEIAAALPESIKTLFLNDNRLSRLSDALPLGHLRGLRVLSLGGNPMRLEGFLEDTLVESQWESSEDLAVESQLGNGEQGRRGEGGHEGDEKSLSGLNGQKSAGLGLFIGLECLFLSATAIEDLGSLDQLRCLPALTDVRLQQTPLLRSLRDEDQFRLLVAVLPMAQHINGSKVTDKERPSAERAFVRFWHDREGKPHRYWELIKVHGELAPLADVDLSAPPEKVRVAVDLFGQEEIEMTVRTRWSVMKLCGELSKRTGVPDTLLEVSKMSKGEMEAEELMFPGLTLSRYDLVNGDRLIVKHAQYGLAVPNL